MEQRFGDPLLWRENPGSRFSSRKEVCMEPVASPVARCISMAAVLVTFGLAGCASVDKFFKEQREAEEQRHVNIARESCKRYGFTENTDAFAQCIQNDINAAKARKVAEEKAAEEPVAPAASRKISTSCTKTVTGMDCAAR
jgi:hypothetical protein